eukprot:2171488-Heterocapsa_arctica.AAC.1
MGCIIRGCERLCIGRQRVSAGTPFIIQSLNFLVLVLQKLPALVVHHIGIQTSTALRWTDAMSVPPATAGMCFVLPSP